MLKAPDHAQFEYDLGLVVFAEGTVRGRWWFVALNWPFAVFAVRARDKAEFGFRFDCTGYPLEPPTARLWSLELDAAPEPGDWPKGSQSFVSVFNPSWKDGTALYHPFDRISRQGHGDWPKQYPHLVWDSGGTFVQYLAENHRLLNGRGYHGK